MIVDFADEDFLAVVTATSDMINTVFSLQAVWPRHKRILAFICGFVKSFHVSRSDPYYPLSGTMVIVQLLEELTPPTTIKIPKQYRVEEVLREELKR
ncbi:MAG: hypothetical protein KKE55_07320 [Candidatus Omnitrophica bacterium]|nr:hypothetical protein [Candidatus Omnitrophota bacterium]